MGSISDARKGEEERLGRLGTGSWIRNRDGEFLVGLCEHVRRKVPSCLRFKIVRIPSRSESIEQREEKDFI
jgi:hypothetical protein